MDRCEEDPPPPSNMPADCADRRPCRRRRVHRTEASTGASVAPPPSGGWLEPFPDASVPNSFILSNQRRASIARAAPVPARFFLDCTTIRRWETGPPAWNRAAPGCLADKELCTSPGQRQQVYYRLHFCSLLHPNQGLRCHGGIHGIGQRAGGL